MTAAAGPVSVRSTIPARIDRLPWSSFHRRLVVALGVCWVLDGYEITVAANIGEQLADTSRFGLGGSVVAWLAAVYLIGEVLGALVFGHLSDRLGRRRLFLITLTLYMAGSTVTALVPGTGIVAVAILFVSRLVAGAGIGGEYAAINSTIDELVPARCRGQVDIAVNGTYWAGAAVAGAVQVPLLSGAIDPDLDWRLPLLLGPAVSLLVLTVRRRIPESPRWLLTTGQVGEAERIVGSIEKELDPSGRLLRPVDESESVEVKASPTHYGYAELLWRLYHRWPGRAVLGATVMVAQSIFYNIHFFLYATVLVRYFSVEADSTASYIIPFAVGNLLGPLVLGPLFDRVGRRRMITRTYLLSGLLLLATGGVHLAGGFTATTQVLAWATVFFFASAGASAAYLTVSEIFPVQVRAKAIALFFALAQTAGAVATLLCGVWIDRTQPAPTDLLVGFGSAGLIMIAAGLVARRLAVDAENKPLEEIAPPLGPRQHTS